MMNGITTDMYLTETRSDVAREAIACGENKKPFLKTVLEGTDNINDTASDLELGPTF